MLNKIGYAALLNLPDDVQEVLKETRDIETKVKMLELILKTL